MVEEEEEEAETEAETEAEAEDLSLFRPGACVRKCVYSIRRQVGKLLPVHPSLSAFACTVMYRLCINVL